MTSLIKFPLDGDKAIWVEVEDPAAEGGTVRAGRLGDALKTVQAKVTFDEALNQVCTSTERIISRLRQLSDQPNDIEVVFGFTMNAEIGASISKVSSDGNFMVTMKWQQETQKDT